MASKIVPYDPVIINARKIKSPEEAYLIFKSIWNKELLSLQEQFMALFFNKSNQLIGWRLLNTGTMKSTFVDVKLLVPIALKCMACSVIVAHNHPSGNLEASEADVNVTNQIRDALKLIDVKLQDHLILASTGFLSMQEGGLF